MYGYSHIGMLLSLSAVNAFYFGKGLLAGIGIAMLLSFVWPSGGKTVLSMRGVLFIGFILYAMTHYDLRHINACPRAFYSINAMLIGMAATLVFLWLAGEEAAGTPNAGEGVASAALTGNGTEHLRA